MERGFLTSNTKPKKNNRESGVMNNEGLDEAFVEGIAAKIKNIDGKLRMPIHGEPLKSSRAAHVLSVKKGFKVENVHTYVGGPPIKSILKKVVTLEKEDANKEGTETLSDHSFASVLCPKAAVHKGDFRTLVNEEIIADSDCVLPKAAADLVKNMYVNCIVGGFLWNQFCSCLIEIDARSVKKEVIMAIPEEVGNGHIIEVIRVEYEWKPSHCVECQSFGHNLNSCPKQFRVEILKTLAMDIKATTMKENDDGFVEVKSRKKKKVADPRSFGVLRLNKPNSKVIWQQKKGGDTKGGSNSASPSVSTNDKGNGNGGSKLDLDTSNPFDVLNVEEETMCESGKQTKEKNVSSSPELKNGITLMNEILLMMRLFSIHMVHHWEVEISLKTKILISMMAMRIRWLISKDLMKYWEVIMLRKWCESDLQRVVCLKGRCVRIMIMSSPVSLSNDDDWIDFCFDVILDCVSETRN
nr:hypothetical protein [Tanacetum cinerariifolium]